MDIILHFNTKYTLSPLTISKGKCYTNRVIRGLECWKRIKRRWIGVSKRIMADLQILVMMAVDPEMIANVTVG